MGLSVMVFYVGLSHKMVQFTSNKMFLVGPSIAPPQFGQSSKIQVDDSKMLKSFLAVTPPHIVRIILSTDYNVSNPGASIIAGPHNADFLVIQKMQRYASIIDMIWTPQESLRNLGQNTKVGMTTSLCSWRLANCHRITLNAALELKSSEIGN